MIKLNSLSRWTALKKGDVLSLPGDAERRIRLEVNAPDRAPLYLISEAGEMSFLAAPVGRDVIEFAAPGHLRIATTAEDVSVYCSETEPTSVVIPDAEVFTQIAQRAARNPDMEHLMFLQNVNIDRRMAQLAAEMDQKVANAYAAGLAAAPAGAPPVADGVRASEPNPVGGVAAAPAGADAAPAPAPAAAGSDPAAGSAPVDGGSAVSPVGEA